MLQQFPLYICSYISCVVKKIYIFKGGVMYQSGLGTAGLIYSLSKVITLAQPKGIPLTSDKFINFLFKKRRVWRQRYRAKNSLFPCLYSVFSNFFLSSKQGCYITVGYHSCTTQGCCSQILWWTTLQLWTFNKLA